MQTGFSRIVWLLIMTNRTSQWIKLGRFVTWIISNGFGGWFKTENPRNPNGISFERVEGTHYHAECMRANLWEHIQCLIGILFIKSNNRTWAKSCVLCVLLVQWALVRLRWWIFMFAVSANRPTDRSSETLGHTALSRTHTLFTHKTHILRTRK